MLKECKANPISLSLYLFIFDSKIFSIKMDNNYNGNLPGFKFKWYNFSECI